MLEYFKDFQELALLIPNPDTETIILKDSVLNEPDQVEKALRKYSDTPSFIQMIENNMRINQILLLHWYSSYVADDTHVLMQKESAKSREPISIFDN